MRITLFNTGDGLRAQMVQDGKIVSVRFGDGNLSYKEPDDERDDRYAEAVARTLSREGGRP